MATVIEVQTTKPTVKDITVKLSRVEAEDLTYFLERGGASKAWSPYKTISDALSGKSSPFLTKIDVSGVATF